MMKVLPILSLLLLLAAPAAGAGLGLDQVISGFNISEGAYGIGGAAMFDVITKLRNDLSIPINFEDLERSLDSGLTLAQALKKLHELESKDQLSQPDKLRLARYREIETSDPDHYIIGLDTETHVISLPRGALRELLDQIVEVFSAYEWRNLGTAESPIVVIQPRGKSALNWTLDMECGEAKSITGLLAPGAPLIGDFQRHQIAMLSDGTLGTQGPFAGARVSLCGKGLKASRVLADIVVAAGPVCFWTLSGIEGARFLAIECI